jgi:hypothetical protein
MGERVEWRGAPRVWNSGLEFPSSASHGEPPRTAAQLAHCGTEVEVVDAAAGHILFSGWRNARCIWATPAFKNCIRGFRHCLSVSWLQKSLASDSGYAIRPHGRR